MADQETKVRPHEWMQMTFVPVEVVGLGSDGEPVLVATGEEETRVGCTACHLGLTDMSMEIACEGKDDEED